MLVDFESLSEESRVYYFPSSRKFYAEEVPSLEEEISEQCKSLDDVEIGYQVLYDRFVIFFVSDQTPLSIEQNDRLVEFVLSLEKKYGVTLLDRVNVCFKQGEFVQRKEIKEFKKLIKNKSVSSTTVVLDPMINTKSEFISSWEVPAAESWLGHLF